MAVAVEPLAALSLLTRASVMVAENLLVRALPLLVATMVGGAMFLVLVLRPLGWTLGAPGAAMQRDTARIVALAGLLVAGIVGFTLLTDRPELLTGADILQASPQTQIVLAEVAASLLIVLLVALGWGTGVLLVPLAAVVLAAAALAEHTYSATPWRPVVLGLAAAHELGVALWLGGLPAFAVSLTRVEDGLGWRSIAVRFGRLSVVGMLVLVGSGIGLGVFTATGMGADLSGLYGTRFGALLAAKTVLFLGLLASLAATLRTIAPSGGRRLPIARLKRLATMSLALALAAFVLNAALVSTPPPAQRPADDGVTERATAGDFLVQATPTLPRIASPAAAPDAIRTWLDDAQRRAGLAVLVIGVAALLACAGLRLARQWPLLVVALGVAILVDVEPLLRPFDHVGVLDWLGVPPVLRDRAVAALLVVFGLNEWLVRGRRSRRYGWPLLLPLTMGVGGVVLPLYAGDGLAPAQQAVATFAALPPAVLLVVAAIARWQEVRLDPYEGRWAGWVWAGCVVLIGALLMLYPLA